MRKRPTKVIAFRVHENLNVALCGYLRLDPRQWDI